jgi:hypothetical protein
MEWSHWEVIFCKDFYQAVKPAPVAKENIFHLRAGVKKW